MVKAVVRVILTKSPLRSVLSVVVIIGLIGSGFAYSQSRRSQSTTESTKPQTFLPVLDELIIPKITLKAPIILNVPGEDEIAYLKALEGGVAHFAGTVSPGETGNSVIFAHSGYYKNKPGGYKEIFRHLEQLRPGDDILINLTGRKLDYKVTNSKIVAADALSVIEPIENEKRLTLITCWPPGTIDKRLVVIAELSK